MFVPVMMKQRLDAAKDNPLEKRGDHAFTVKARLKSGVSQRTAQAELATIWKRLQQQYPDANRIRNIAVKTELEDRYQQDPYDAILVGVSDGPGLAWCSIIACANVANLSAGTRPLPLSREIAIRMAVGAAGRLAVRQLLLRKPDSRPSSAAWSAWYSRTRAFAFCKGSRCPRICRS